jgi:hypothetical protein
MDYNDCNLVSSLAENAQNRGISRMSKLQQREEKEKQQPPSLGNAPQLPTIQWI